MQQNFPGTPGTFTGLFLRILQCIFAVGSIAFMLSTKTDKKSATFRFSHLIIAMVSQVTWSSMLAGFDAYALVRKKVLCSHDFVIVFVAGDWAMAGVSLAAASSSAGIAALFYGDFGSCKFGEECHKFQMSIALAYMSWVTSGISSLIMLWLLAAG